MAVIFVCDKCGKNIPSENPLNNLRDFDSYLYMDGNVNGKDKKELDFKAKACLCPDCSSKLHAELTALAEKYKLK